MENELTNVNASEEWQPTAVTKREYVSPKCEMLDMVETATCDQSGSGYSYSD